MNSDGDYQEDVYLIQTYSGFPALIGEIKHRKKTLPGGLSTLNDMHSSCGGLQSSSPVLQLLSGR